jgi:hypothetical protein
MVGVQTSGNVVLINSVVSNSTRAFGDAASGLVGIGTISSVNSIYYNNTICAISASGAGFFTNNAYGSNASGCNTTGFTLVASQTANDIALGACNPFVNASGGNFALSSCGKAALQAKGFPGVAQFGTGYVDLAPLQTQAASGSGGGHAYVQ